MNIDKFKNDHTTVLATVAELRNLVESGVAQNAIAIATKIVAMSGAIKGHLAAEDQYLYPTLSKSADPAVSRAGTKFQADMSGIAAAYGDFAGKWNLGAKVAADPSGFKNHANSIFKTLHQRIQQENQDLYPLAERA